MFTQFLRVWGVSKSLLRDAAKKRGKGRKKKGKGEKEDLNCLANTPSLQTLLFVSYVFFTFCRGVSSQQRLLLILKSLKSLIFATDKYVE